MVTKEGHNAYVYVAKEGHLIPQHSAAFRRIPPHSAAFRRNPLNSSLRFPTAAAGSGEPNCVDCPSGIATASTFRFSTCNPRRLRLSSGREPTMVSVSISLISNFVS